MPKFKFGKLVRDKIVDQQLESGAQPKYHTLAVEAHKDELINKIIEEAKEIKSAASHELANELADIQQALDDLIDRYGLTTEDVAKAQATKKNKSGAFKKGIFIDHIELDEKDTWVDYFRKNADRYPEID